MRSMSRALFVLVLGAAACKRPAAATSSDAGAADAQATVVTAAALDASAAAPDRTLRLVAEGPFFETHALLVDGRVLLTAGPLVYEARPTGELALLGDLGMYGATLPEGEAMVGYVDPVPVVSSVTVDADGALFLHTMGERGFKLAGGKLLSTPTRPIGLSVTWKGRALGIDHGGEVAWAVEPGPAIVKNGGYAEGLAVSAAGELVVLERGDDVARARVHAAQGDAARLAPFPGVLRPTSCGVIPSFDGRVYARCAYGWDDAKPPRAFRLDGATWSPVFEKVKVTTAASIGPDGALYDAVDRAMDLVRCAPGAECEPLALEKPRPLSATPEYISYDSDVIDPATNRTWRTLAIHEGPGSTHPPRVDRVFARGPGDVWVLAQAGDRRLVLRAGPPPRAVARLPRALDARVLVRNEAAPARWVGHCDQLFVRLGPAADEAAISARSGDVRKAVDEARPKGADGEPARAWLVTGRLHRERVVGVVLARSTFDAASKVVERAADRVADKLAKNPVDRPEIYCTLPVLETSREL